MKRLQLVYLMEQITREFISDWNEKRLDKLSMLLSEHIQVESPKVKEILPDNEGSQVKGKEAVMRYWGELNRNYFVFLTLKQFEKQDRTIHCVLDYGVKNSEMLAHFTFTEYGKFDDMVIEYT